MVENRSEEVADFILKEPNWIVRRGLQLIASILVFLLAVSYFISYPDRIEGKTFITTIIPPVKRLCEIDGRIKSIYIKDKTNIIDFVNHPKRIFPYPYIMPQQEVS